VLSEGREVALVAAASNWLFWIKAALRIGPIPGTTLIQNARWKVYGQGNLPLVIGVLARTPVAPSEQSPHAAREASSRGA
jgi:hypothetical protein